MAWLTTDKCAAVSSPFEAMKFYMVHYRGRLRQNYKDIKPDEDELISLKMVNLKLDQGFLTGREVSTIWQNKIIIPTHQIHSVYELGNRKRFLNGELFEGIRQGSLSLCRKALEKGADVNASTLDEVCQSPLHRAVSFNNRRIIKFLLEKGADTEDRDIDFNRPLDIALLHYEYGNKKDYEKTISLLKQYSKEKDSLDSRAIDNWKEKDITEKYVEVAND